MSKATPDNVSALFDILATRFTDAKKAEADAVVKRRTAGDELIGLPEFVAIKKEKGATSLRSEAFKVEVTYVQSETIDMAKVAEQLPVDVVLRIFPKVPTFSQSGFNAYMKDLRNEAITDPKARKLVTRIEAAMKEHTSSKPGATQVAVTRVED